MKPFFALPLAGLTAALLLGACTSSRPKARTGCPSAYGLSAAERTASHTAKDTEAPSDTPKDDEEQTTPDETSTPAEATNVSNTTPTDTTASPIVPTAEQQAAARKALEQPAEPTSSTTASGTTTSSTITSSTTTNKPSPRTLNTTDSNPPPTRPTLPPRGNLRMGIIAPEEDPASSSDAPAHGANQPELRGLRSPKLPNKLPMNIDGKLQGQN